MYNIGLKLDPVVRAVILQLLCVAVGSAVPAIFGYRDLWFVGALFGSSAPSHLGAQQQVGRPELPGTVTDR